MGYYLIQVNCVNEFLILFMKAVDRLSATNYIRVMAMTPDGSGSFSMDGTQISPRGVCTSCSPEQIAAFHGACESEHQPKFQSLIINLELGFASGELVELETAVQVQSIRRISQSEFEVYMSFTDMVQDGYRHIARYMVDSEARTTE